MTFEERELRPDLIATLRSMALQGHSPTELIAHVQDALAPRVPPDSRVSVCAYLCESFDLHLGEVIEAVSRWEGFGDKDATKPGSRVDEEVRPLMAPWLARKEAEGDDR